MEHEKPGYLYNTHITSSEYQTDSQRPNKKKKKADTMTL